LIRAAMDRNGGFIGQKAGAELVREKYPGFGVKRAMALVKELTMNDKPGPKRPEKIVPNNRASQIIVRHNYTFRQAGKSGLFGLRFAELPAAFSRRNRNVLTISAPQAGRRISSRKVWRRKCCYVGETRLPRRRPRDGLPRLPNPDLH
jgi:hypothetical protein